VRALLSAAACCGRCWCVVSLLLGGAIVVGAAAVSVLLMAAVRRRLAAPLVNEPARGTTMITFVGTAFAVLLAFITLAAFQTYNGAKTGAATEAVALLDMFKSAGFFPASERDELRGDFVCYGRAVIHHEWPTMRRGERAPLVDAWIAAYRTVFQRLTLRSAGERLGLQDMLASARDRTDGRRDRLSEATPSVPTPVWVGLVLAGCIAVLIQLVMADPREHMLVQGVMIGGVAAMVSIGLLLINFLDHPYRSGPGSIQPREMTATLTMMREQEPGLRVPCRADGVAFPD
jgi:multisubunit Na+/H+ antiporter MnhB subunit